MSQARCGVSASMKISAGVIVATKNVCHSACRTLPRLDKISKEKCVFLRPVKDGKV